MSKNTANFPKLKPWTDVAPTLVDVAMGRKPADMVVRSGRWVNVHSRNHSRD
jgi:adenine deaminase